MSTGKLADIVWYLEKPLIYCLSYYYEKIISIFIFFSKQKGKIVSLAKTRPRSTPDRELDERYTFLALLRLRYNIC